MTKTQEIIPVRCPGCGALREGIQDENAIYYCGTKLRVEETRVTVLRSPSCHRGVVARLVLKLTD